MPLGGANALGASNVGLVSSFTGVQNEILVPLWISYPLSNTILNVLWASRMNCTFRLLVFHSRFAY